MDFFFEDLPSTSQSTPKKGPEDSRMREDTDHDSLRGKSSSVSTTDIQEQHSRCAPKEPIHDQRVSSGIDDISRRAQELVEKINHNRTSDQNMIDSFQETLIEKVTEMCQQMKEHMYTVYEENSDNMQVKLQELSEVLESCTKLSHELLEASRALASLREGLAISQEIEL
ncbi:synaptonemal complex central element protein 2 isoform X1 [Archocentrus centrarchus]|uniref:synaptonemal complex central element protein 2 isoform X1 n=1 Tax=Archocentrus centrarchus TaxID=63155 RepID=UPI0011EA1B7C|nr:synaptonemal complex central element protein 2 isoform X1 [Archocentrus centrarchus]XP_030597895.1 synaptonemal complex central element protein 2 isoform X1 [Archocentrus centrarchus]XP_030597903.1 synaptonemal complex central element protein 2 isoform X1 [Archocentrus centrarchus]